MAENLLGIGFTVREKFGWTLPALKRLYEYAPLPFTLYFVDCGYPPAVLREVQEFLRDKPDVVWIRSERFLYPGESFNEVVGQLFEPWLCLVQNDVLVEPDCLRRMLDAVRELHCDIVSPLLLEYEGERRSVHRHAPKELHIGEVDGRVRVDLEGPQEQRAGCTRIHRFEGHILMMSAQAARELHPFPALNSREHLEMSVHAWRHGLKSFRVEAAVAGYVESALRDYDCDFYRWRWNPERAEHSTRYVAWKWNITQIPYVKNFIDARSRYLLPERVLPAPAEIFETDIYRNLPPFKKG